MIAKHWVWILLTTLVCLWPAAARCEEQPAGAEAPWCPDNGDGTYKNPVLLADYSDPDVVQVGDDFYLVSSSFSNFPGLPVLHSRDLVNWTIVGHAVPRFPFAQFDQPQHGNGIWAPAIRYHNGEYYIYFAEPDLGIFMTKTHDPAGQWEPPVRVWEGKGRIDPARSGTTTARPTSCTPGPRAGPDSTASSRSAT